MNCPECGGPALYNWVLRHTNTCTIRDAEDATQNADRERLDQLPGRWPFGSAGFSRPATAAERTLVVASGHSLSVDPQTVVSWEQYRYRVIDGHATP